MTLDDLLAAFERGEDPFTLERALRRTDPALADALVIHREAIRAGGLRQLLQRLGKPAGEVWLEPLIPPAAPGRPFWGHDGEVRWMRVDGVELVTRGDADGRLRRWATDGTCLEDRDATEADDVRLLDGQAVALLDDHVELRDPHSGAVVRSVPLPHTAGERNYVWREKAVLLPTGLVALLLGEDHPGSLYGAQYHWERFDPRDGSTLRMEGLDSTVPFDGGTVVALPSGSLRLVDDPGVLERQNRSQWPVTVVAFGAGRLGIGSRGGLALHDREGRFLVKAVGQHPMSQVVFAGDRVVTASGYDHQGARARAHAIVSDLHTGTMLRKVEAGSGYKDEIFVDPTGRRAVSFHDAELRITDLGDGRQVVLPRPWQYAREVAWSADGARLAVQTQAMALCLWDLDACARERLITVQILDSATFGFSVDRTRVLVDHSVYALRTFDSATGEPGPVLKPGLNIAHLVAEGDRALVAGVEGGFWVDLANNEKVRLVDQSLRNAVKRVDILEGKGLFAGPGAIGVDLAEGRITWRWEPQGDERTNDLDAEHPYGVCLPRGAALLSRAGVLRIFQGPTPAHTIQAHDAEGTGLVRAGTTTVISAGGRTLRAWDTLTGACLWTREAPADVLRLSTGGGRVLFMTWRGQGATRAWHLHDIETWEALPLPDMRHPELLADGRRAISLDPVWRLDVFDAVRGEAIRQVPFGEWTACGGIAFDGDAVAPRREGGLRARAGGDVVEVLEGDEVIARWVEPGRDFTCAAVDGDRVVAGDRLGDFALWALRRQTRAPILLPCDEGGGEAARLARGDSFK